MLGVISVTKKKHSEKMMKVHMVKYYSISNSFKCDWCQKEKLFWGKWPKQIMIPIITINLWCFKWGDLLKFILCVSVWHEKGTFLLISLSQILYYTLQTTWYGITKNILGKLPDLWWIHINTFNFEGCHKLTHIFQMLIIITFFNLIDD